MKGLEHLQNLVSMRVGVPETSPPWIPRDDCIYLTIFQAGNLNWAHLCGSSGLGCSPLCIRHQFQVGQVALILGVDKFL